LKICYNDIIPYFSGLVNRYKNGQGIVRERSGLKRKLKEIKTERRIGKERDEMCRGSRAIRTRKKYVGRSFREF